MSDRDHTTPDEDRQWWYCLRHSKPEQGPGCPGKYRLGPYPDEATAAAALNIVAERNESWDEQDRD
ncbi:MULTISPECIES: hypothetical protein [Streptomonospora]|uniref:SPOR domain-containing protein n=2 Tax=Streptomonospora TaxID=104204 RepID=A0ABV9SID9_9ACTN